MASSPAPRIPALAQFGVLEGLVQALADGADPSERDAHGWSALDYSARNGRAECALALLDAGAPIDGPHAGHFYPGYTPLMIAVNHAQLGMAEILLARGADPRATNPRGWTALDVCLSMGGQSVSGHPMRVLLESYVLALAERKALDAQTPAPLPKARAKKRAL